VKGTLEEGKLADIAILSDNPLKVKPEEISKIRVEMTIIGGEIVFFNWGF
jgi:predicted amidohydrolase YtcJ